jgi:hypothetical protein
LMQSEKSKMHLKLEERQKEHKKESSNSAATSPTSTPPPSHSTASSSSLVFANVQLPSIPSPSSLFANWGRGGGVGSKETTATLIPAATDGKTTAKKDGDDVNDDEKDASPKSPIAVVNRT